MRAIAAKPSDSEKQRSLRPGLVAGASANDPTTVGALAIVGATTVYGLAWLVVAILPMLAITQVIAGTVGAATGTSVQGAIVRRFGLLCGVVSLIAIVAVNVFTIVADVEAGGQALSLLFHISYRIFVIPFAAAVCVVLMTNSYVRVARLLMYLPVLFVAYGVSAILAHAQWSAVLHSILVPHIEISSAYIAGGLALVGTTITSYEYVWESIEVSESGSGVPQAWLRRDAILGVLVAGAGFLFVLVATGATVGMHHLPIETAADAARALEPLAGPWASVVFAVGLFGSAALTVPILASSTGYVVAQTLGWTGTLDAPATAARRFYAVIIIVLAIAAAGALLGLPPIRLLFSASIAGGLGTPITLVLMNAIARNRETMSTYRISLPLSIAGWTVTGLVILACSAFLLFTFQSR